MPRYIKIAAAVQMACILLWLVQIVWLEADTYAYWLDRTLIWLTLATCWVWLYPVVRALKWAFRRHKAVGILLTFASIFLLLTLLPAIIVVSVLSLAREKISESDRFVLISQISAINIKVYEKHALINKFVSDTPLDLLPHTLDSCWEFHDSLGVAVVGGYNYMRYGDETFRTHAFLVTDTAAFGRHHEAAMRLKREMVSREGRYIIECYTIQADDKKSLNLIYDTKTRHVSYYDNVDCFDPSTTMRTLSAADNDSIISFIRTHGAEPIDYNPGEMNYLNLTVNGRDLVEITSRPHAMGQQRITWLLNKLRKKE